MAVGLAALRLRPRTDMDARLADIPARAPYLTAPVTIRWDEHHIPFVFADTDGDAAFALGLVHAHLRLAQMEIMRRLALGRVAEIAGPAAVPLDQGLRLLGFAPAARRIAEILPPSSRAWAEAFAAGVTHLARHAAPPPEFAWLGLKPEPWTILDVLAVGRLASADVNWLILFNILKLRSRADWPSLWAELTGDDGKANRPSTAGENPLGVAATAVSRPGSNAIAVAGRRSRSGAALLAADPHLSITLPNLWLIAGVKCPSLHAAGLMIPGLPFIAIGRNPDAAWAGTSLQAASSDLFDATGLPTATRADRLAPRWSRKADMELRTTPLGPLISDCPLVPSSGALALRWVGHDPSDELTAWLDVARATTWPAFRAAADRMAVPGQNLVWASRSGSIGKLMAVRLPRRPPHPAPDLVLPPAYAAAWQSFVTSRDLPSVVDPPDGIVASANERPEHAPVAIGQFFPTGDRFHRLLDLVGGRRAIDLDHLAEVQLDVHSREAAELKDWIAARLDGHPIAEELRRWDGAYDAASATPAAFEHLLDRLYRFSHGNELDTYWATWNPTALMRRRLASLDDAASGRLVRWAADELGAGRPAWGDIHRLRISHFLGRLPGLARLGLVADLPVPGGNDTVHKTAHGLAGDRRHAVQFGANARFLADLADPDATRIVLLGGQDGWPTSTTYLDQLAPWREGESLELPLRPETVRARFSYRTVLRP
ncbi:MAG: penicillin acylase family protein [Solirubrobacterales bacterium]